MRRKIISPEFAHPLIFMRHGATDWNKASRYQGHTETSLSPTGEQQVARVAQMIAGLQNTRSIDLPSLSIVCSPLLRAQQSAKAVAGILSVSESAVHIENRLRELSMGRWEGLDSQQVKERFYDERKSRKSDRWAFKPLGGESLCGREVEVREAVRDLPPHTIIVTHAGILRIVLHVLGGLNTQQAAEAHVGHEEILMFDGQGISRLSPEVS